MQTDAKGRQSDFQREQAVFLAAVELAGSAERSAFLDRACAENSALRRRVEALLVAHDAEGSLPPAGAASAETLVPEAVTGALIAGKYKLLEQIGIGGMGVVWMAEQRSPVRRLVAVKLIKAGMDSRSVITRFEAERQALALMDHPNIARVFDGGATDQGRPWFAMELVRGVPVTQYCDQRRMTVRARLTLFMQICQAVQHAHQKGIIHRDIKPTNVLVTEHDGKPVPKVIDFGLAKALGGPGVLTEHTLHTAFGAMAGTPLYTAPEQVAINSLDIDTRADIFSLGNLLYELLTGSPPLEQERLKKVAWDEVCRVIREEEPPRPSMRISTSMILPNLAASRQIDPGKLSGLIKGDLDWIILKALEKERRLRYDTATALVADIERHLNDEPVVAAPPTLRYRARKFVRKHKAGVLASAAGATLLTLGLTTTTWQWRRADTNAKTATRNERVAEARKTEADKQRDAAELEAYISNIALSQTAMLHGSWAEARRRLESCPVSKRGFEWKFLAERAQSVVCDMPVDHRWAGLSADGRLCLTYCDSSNSKTPSSQLWELSGNPVGKPMEGLGYFSPNGQLVASDLTHGIARLYDLTGTPVGDRLKMGNLNAAEIVSPDGLWVLTMPENNAVQLKEVSGAVAGATMRHSDLINSAVFSPDGRCVLTACADGTARLWDVSGTPVGEIMRVNSSVKHASFVPGGKLVFTVSDKQVVRVWDLGGKPVGDPMKDPYDYPLNLSKDGKIFTTFDPGPRVWTLDGRLLTNSSEYLVFPYWQRHLYVNPSSGFSPDGKLKMCMEEEGRAIQLRDGGGMPVAKLMRSDDLITWACFSPNGKLVVTRSRDEIIRLWDLAGNPIVEMISAFVDAGQEVHFTGDSNQIVARNDRHIELWDLQGRLIGMATDGDGYELDPHGDNVITNTSPYHMDNVVHNTWPRLLRIDHFDTPGVDLECNAALVREERAALDVALHRALPLLNIDSPSRTIRRNAAPNIVELAAAGLSPVTLRHDHSVTAMALSPDDLRAITLSDNVIRFWETTSGREIADIPAAASVHNLEFTPDGAELILTTDDGHVRIWDSRPPGERQRDSGVRLGELRPAEGFVETLLATATSNEQLADSIRRDVSLNAIRKVQALAWLGHRLNGITNRASEIFSQISDQALTREELRQRFASFHCPPRVADTVAKSIYEWKEPTGDDLIDAAYRIWATPALPDKRFLTAIQIVDVKINTSPTDPKMLWELGAGHYRVGRLKEAVQELTRSVQTFSADGQVVDDDEWAFLAMTQFKLGQVDAAKQVLAKMAHKRDLSDLQSEAISLINPASTQPTTSPTTAPSRP